MARVRELANAAKDRHSAVIIAGGVPDTLMPGWGFRLTDYDLQSLVAYLRSLEAFAPPIVPPIIGP